MAEVSFVCGQFRTFRPGLVFGQHYHVDRHDQLARKQLRLFVLNEMHTNSYIGPRLDCGTIVIVADEM